MFSLAPYLRRHRNNRENDGPEREKPLFVRSPPLAQLFLAVYVQGMTQAVAQILGEFDQLAEKERQELRRAIVERVPMSDDLTDDDFAALAAASFRALDEEENTPRA